MKLTEAKRRFGNSVFMVLIIVIFLNIIIIILNLTYLSTNELELIVTTITGVVTILILLWALNESKKNNVIIQQQNKIIMAQSKYYGFKNEIKQLKDDGSHVIFANSELKFINDKYHASLPETNYINFFNTAYTFHFLIKNDRYYQKYLEQLSINKTLYVDADDIFNVENLVDLLKIIKDKFIIERIWLREIRDKYHRILTSVFLTKPYREELFLELDLLCEDYFEYCKEISNVEYDIRQLGLQKNADGTVMILMMKEFSEHIIGFYKSILDIKDQLEKLKE